MISLDRFLSCVRENASRIHGYESGHDGSDGKSDCIGLIIGALKLAGVKWPGIHGSNWAVRNDMETFGYIASAGEMFLGEIVYKAREPGDAKYDLPERYKNSGDLRDYYHVGVVTCIDPLCITHCTSVEGGIQRDSKQGAWKYGGKLKYVDYEEGGGDMHESYTAIVMADSGSTVNLRSQPNAKSTILAKVPIGTEVSVTDYDPDPNWMNVETGGKTGYMMAKFLRPASAADDRTEAETVTIQKGLLEDWANALESLAADIRGFCEKS